MLRGKRGHREAGQGRASGELIPKKYKGKGRNEALFVIWLAF